MDQQEDSTEDDEQEEPVEDKESPPGEGSPETSRHRGPAALRGFSEAEQRLILHCVDRFWSRWGAAFTAASHDDMLGVAVLALHEVRGRMAALPDAAAARFAAVAIYRRMRKRLADDFRQRLLRPARNWVELTPERLQRLVEESAADWDALVGDTLIDEVEDPRVTAALAALSSLDRRILDLKFIEGLKHREIAGRLNAAPEQLPHGRVLTARSVENRFQRAMKRLRESLGVE